MKSKMVNGITFFQKSALDAVHSVVSKVPVIFKGLDDHTSGESLDVDMQVDNKNTGEEKENFDKLSKRYKTSKENIVDSVDSEGDAIEKLQQANKEHRESPLDNEFEESNEANQA